MPFTLSHPAAVLPLMRRPFSRTALVAGAVAPDLPYFLVSTGLPVSAQSWYEPFANATTTHGVSGVVSVTLPYALLLWALLRAARRPLAFLLPSSVPWAPSGAAGPPVRRAGWIVLSALVGIASHLVWDAFTHVDGFVVTRTPWLASTPVGGLTWARALQHASTIGGLAAIALFAWRRREHLLPGSGRPWPVGGPRRQVLLAMALFTAAGAVVHAWWWRAGPEAETTGPSAAGLLEGVLSDAAKGAGAGLIAALALYVLAWWIRHAVTEARSGRSGASGAGPVRGD
ncbi:DUF4184 family protein [Kitasatospora sp. NPDC091257]|uniref:DUF4184 family protein n=1 Tax=Kitasatospora sp. NPDC091257 TaxID=3364084 RepID=UPI00380AECFF